MYLDKRASYDNLPGSALNHVTASQRRPRLYRNIASTWKK